MSTYLILCLLSYLIGRGLLKIVGLPVDSRSHLFLAPVVTLFAGSLFLGWSCLLGLPVRTSWIPGWTIGICLAAIGARGACAEIRKEIGVVAVIVLCPVALMAFFFAHGIEIYPGNLQAFDGWLYVAQGQYLWEYPLGTEGGLQPLHQFATIYPRFLAAAFLAFLSPLTLSPGETHLASGYFLAFAFFVVGNSCAYFAAERSKALSFTLIYIFVTVFSGCFLNLISTNNFDNVESLVFIPLFLGLARRMDLHDKRCRLLAGTALASSLYCYPEGFPFVLTAWLLSLIDRRLRTNDSFRGLAVFIATSILVAVVLTLPWVPGLGRVIAFDSEVMALPIGGCHRCFPELLDRRRFIGAIWGAWSISAGGERLYTSQFYLVFTNALGAILSVLLVLGLYIQLKRKDYSLGASILMLLAASLYFAVGLHYPYASFKAISLGWFGMTYLILEGTASAIRAIKNSLLQKTAQFAAYLCLLATVALVCIRIEFLDRFIGPIDFSCLQKVRDIDAAIASAGLAIDVRNPIRFSWALYFLRDRPLDIVGYNHPFIQRTRSRLERLKRSRLIDPAQAPFLLTDVETFSPNEDGSPPVWSGCQYRVTRRASVF